MAALAIAASITAQGAQPGRTAEVLAAMDARLRAQTDVWFKEGDYPRVVQLLRVRAEYNIADFETWTDLGWMLENTARRDEALAVYVRFRNANPDDPDSAFPEANFYFRLRLYAKVPPLIEPKLDLRPHGNSWRILAHSYERMGLLLDSRRIWERYIAINPEDGAARNNLRRVQQRLAAPDTD
jgi:tetratricopeptide (TPR) repeat protein